MCLISSLIKSYIPGKCFLRSPAGNMYSVYLVFMFILSYWKMSHGKGKPKTNICSKLKNKATRGGCGGVGKTQLRFSK